MTFITSSSSVPSTSEIDSSNNINLRSYLNILRRRWLPAVTVFSSVLGLTALITFTQKPVFEAQSKLLLKKTNSTAALTSLGGQLGQLDQLASQASPLDTEAQVLTSSPLLLKTIKALNLRDKEGKLFEPEVFAKKLKVKPVTKTDVLTISYINTDPVKAAAVVNYLVNAYIKNNILVNRTEAIAARQFIESQLPKTELTLQKAEADLRRFKELNRVVDLEEEAKTLVASDASLYAESTKAQAALANANSRWETLRNQVGVNPSQALTLNSLSQSPSVQKALAQYQAVEGELAVKRTLLQDGHPDIIDLQEQKAALRKVLQQRIAQVTGSSSSSGDRRQVGETQQKLAENLLVAEVDRQGLSSQINAIAQERTALQQRAERLPRIEQQQLALQRKVDTSQSTFTSLLQKLQNVQITENQNTGNTRLIEPAMVPIKPVSPKKVRNLALGGILGIFGGIASIFLLQSLDRSIKTVKEARELFEYTLLGTIPIFKKPGKRNRLNKELNLETALPVRDNPKTSLAEAYRMLQANLKFLNSDKQLKSIVITSSVPKEGKSTVSANLALAAAELGQRILLIDADMRRPTQHQVWELPNLKGLSNVLVGQSDLSESIQQASKNIDVLTTGALPPNPIVLIDSQHMLALVESFTNDYDFVIIDTPPLAVAADARILGKMTDGILMIVHPEIADIHSARKAKEFLAQGNQNVLGIVVNGVVPENEPDSYYYYYAQGYHPEDNLNEVNEKVVSSSLDDLNHK